MELRCGRDLDVACAEYQGWGIGSAGRKHQGDGESRPEFHANLSAVGTVLGRTTGHKRPGLCGSLCADALHSGSVHRERADEMGAVGSHRVKHSALVGPQFYAIYRLLLRLYTDV